jgi:PAS domain S-box-containing protein
MNVLTDIPPKKPDIPLEIQSGWQRIVDLMAGILSVPAGLIMKVDPPQIEVYLSSVTENNPLPKGTRAEYGIGMYCETVMEKRAPLLVPDASKDPAWCQSPGAKMGMVFYLGYPLVWPDGEIFGTICVLDEKENPRAIRFRELLCEFQQVIERDLRLIIGIREREDLMAELQRHSGRLREMVGEQTAELEENKAMLEERIRFEDLVSDISTNFVNIPPDRVDGEISLAMGRVCRFFGAENGGFMEVHADRRQIVYLYLSLQEEKRRTLQNVDVAADFPWIYHQLVERGDPIVFSTPDALPPEAGVDRGIWDKVGVRSLLVLPLRIAGKVTHLIGMSRHHTAYEWPAVYIGRLRVIGGIFANALDHAHAQEAILRSERELAEAQRITHLGSWDWDIRNDVHHWSDEFYRIFGLRPQESGATFEAFLASVHPDDRSSVRQANIESISDPGKTYNIEYRVVRPDGAERVVHARGEVFFDTDRRPLRMVGTLLDITESKRAEEALRESERKYRELVQLANSVILRWKYDGTISFINEYGQAFFGYRAEELIGNDVRILMPASDVEGFDMKGLVQSILDDPKRYVTNINENICRDGRRVWMNWANSVIYDENGNVAEVLAVGNDITRAKQAEKQLEEAFREIKNLKEKLEEENIYLREEVNLEGGFGEIVGSSDPIRNVIYKIRQVAPSRTTVLLTGETGTGKGLFARFLHDNSGRRDKPFVNVNCAGLPPNLIESELFGREKGAFTGSTARQIGRFELADGGTIFLDEIGELPLELQSKLLKVIEDGEFERLGSPRSVKVDVRIVAATSRNLEEEIKTGRFRQDLFYRLNVFPITIPPLRKRKEDIPLLVRYFVANFSRNHGKRITKIPGNVLDALEKFDWPGNVRELINVLERAVIVSTGPELRLAEPIAAAREKRPKEPETRVPKDLAGVERDHILKTLEETGWRIEGPEGAARLLAMNPSTLRARIRKLGIKRPGAR